MRFMMFMIPGEVDAWEKSPAEEEDVGAMMKFNEELSKAGVLLALDGLTPPSQASRVSYTGGTPTVTDGPFAEAKEMIGGYWVIEATSQEEAVDWARRIPAGDKDVVEIRRVYEVEDFPPEAQQILNDSDVFPMQR